MSISIFFVVLGTLMLQTRQTRSELRVDVQVFENETYVSQSGSEISIITDTEAAAWKLYPDSACKDEAQAVMGERPTDCYLKEPTQHKLYPTYGWSEVKSTNFLIDSWVETKDKKAVFAHSQRFENTNSNISTTVNLNVKRTVSQSVTVKTSSTTELNAKMSVSIAGTGGEWGFKHTLGIEEANTQTVTLELAAGVTATLPPQSSLTVEYYLYEAKAKIYVKNRNSLSGCVALNYSNKHNGHYFWCYTRDRDSKEIVETFDVDYYTYGYIQTKNFLSASPEYSNVTLSTNVFHD